MGLDVYMSRWDNFDESQKLEQEFTNREKSIWESLYNKDGVVRTYTDLDEQEKVKARESIKAVAAELGLDEHGSADKETIEIPSAKHPEHIFKIGYFRSSYNEGGINNVLRNMTGESLYSIFELTGEEYHVLPNWSRVKTRLAEVRSKLDAIKDDCGGYFNVTVARINPFISVGKLVQSPSDAMEIFRREAKRHKKLKTEDPKQYEFGNYGNSNGDFYFSETLKVSAILPGVEERILREGQQSPVTYLIGEMDMTYYLQALDIVEETADWVMAQPNPEQYRLRWSS